MPMLPRDQQGYLVERLAEARTLQEAGNQILTAAAAARIDPVDAITAGTVSVG